jgi:chromosome segregation ATPase
MAKVSISEAARLVGVSRSNLYKSYIKQGKLSTSTNHQGKPEVDTSELLRVFGSLQQCTDTVDTGGQVVTPLVDSSRQVVTPQEDSGNSLQNQQLREQLQAAQIRLELLQEQLIKADEREQFYQQQLKDLTQTIKLLEYKPESAPRHWWQWWR